MRAIPALIRCQNPHMTKPITRVLAVLELLQAHGRISGAELARRLDVDVRTVRRYISTLEDMGVPVMAERGRDGGYRLVAGFKLPPMMFSNDETLALSLGLVAARGLGIEQTAAAASAHAKLERVMPAELKRRARAVAEAATLDLPTAIRIDDSDALVTLSSAVQAQQRVRFHYRAGQDEGTDREVDPYGLVYRYGRWYLIGWCHLRRDLRSFRLDRLTQPQPLAASFLRPADFDAAQHLRFSISTLPRAMAVDVRLYADLNAAATEIGDGVGLLIPQPDHVLLQTRTDSLDWFARLLMRLSFDFEVLHPPELRSALRKHAQRMLSRHGTPEETP
jgi:predicted DNA-binding transcriptional regulator YafY